MHSIFFRLRDVLAATVGLVLTGPLLLIVAVAVRLDSGGPILFRQERVGLHGRTFRIRKFRSMVANQAGPAVTATSDARVTRVGRLIRALKMDELPQLIDVLVGNMSLVGPRPEVPKYVRCWPVEARHKILSVRPGITDPASVRYRNESELLATFADPEAAYVEHVLPQKVAIYMDYVEHRTFMGDVRILAQTMRAIISVNGRLPV